MSQGCWLSLVHRSGQTLLWVLFFSVMLVPRSIAVEPPEKAARYHTALLRRPNPGYLFDRFYNAWLDEDTVEHLEAFLTKNAESGNSEDGLLLAFFFAKQGEELKAIEQFRATLQRDPTSADAWYEKAVIESRLLNFETALADLDKSLEAEPEQKLAVKITKLKGQLLVRDRRRAEAIEVWKKLLGEYPDDEDLREDVIELEINEGLFDEAAELSQALIERTKDPYRKVLRTLRLGDIRQRAGDREAAVAIYRDTLEQVGADSWIEREILAQIERLYRREDNVSALREQYETLLESYPRRVGIRRSYAKVLSELGENEAAIEAFREILKLTPGDRGHQEAFIQLLSEADAVAEAIKQLQTLIEQYPQDPELYVQLSGLQAKLEKPAEAEAAVEKYLAASDKSEYAYLRAARLLDQLKLGDAAKQMYARMVEAHPDSVSAKEAHAAFLYKIDDKETALEIWRELAAAGDPEQMVRIARTLTSRQEHETAFEVLNKQAEAFSNNSLYLGQLVAAAVPLSKFEEAADWALRRVELADSDKELQDAVVQAARVISRGERAVAITAELQNNDSRTVPQTCLLAELLEEAGDSTRADEVLAPLAEQGEMRAIAQQIRLAASRRNWKGAIAAMRRVIDLPEGRKSANVRQLVEYLERDYQIEEALVWIEQWKKLSPGSISPWISESRLQLFDGKSDMAIETLRRGLIEFPDNIDLRSRLAQLYADSGKLADAERIYWQQYEESESLDGKIRAIGQLAELAESQGRVDHLLESFEERRRNNRLSIEPLLALAEIHRVADNYEGRRQALIEASKLKPDDLGLLHQVARIEEQEGDWERARDTLQRAATLDKTSRTRQRIARLHLRYGNTEDGYAILYELTGGKDADPREIEAVADAIAGVGDWQQVGEYLADQVDAHPEDYRLRYLYAIAQEEELQSQGAIEEFLKIMNTQQEIRGLAKPGAPSNTSTYQEMLKKILPPESLDLIMLSQHQYTAYNYRQQQGNLSFTFTSGASAPITRVHLPSRIKDVHHLALTHLISIARELEEAETAELLARLKNIGIVDADLLVAMGSDRRQNPNSLAQLVEEFPERDSVLGYYVMIGAQNPQAVDTTLFRKAVDRFADSYPQLAIMAALKCGNSEEVASEYLDQALAMMDNVKEPNYLLMFQLCNAMGGLRTNQGNSLPEKYRPRIMEKLIDWYPSLRDNQAYGSWMSLNVLASVKTAGDLQTYITLLEDEVAEYRRGNSKGMQANPFGRNNQTSLAVPTFPPASLEGFPPMLLQLLNKDGQRQIGIATIESSWDDEDLLKALPQVKNPILRALLASSIDAEDMLDAALEETLAYETPSLDAYMLSAGRAADNSEFDEALTLLGKARYLPMKRDTRRRVDGAMVALILERDELPAEDSELMELARGAALRLRHSAVAGQEREQLVSALEDLGLTKEAERLEKKATVAATSGNLRVSPSRSSTPPDRIKQLLDGGKRDAAAKLISRDLISQINQSLANPSNMSYMRRQAIQLADRIKGYGLTDEVMAELSPGDSNNHRRIGTYAIVCEVFGKKDEARKQFAKAHELRPKEELYLVKLVLLNRDEDPQWVAEQLRKLGPAGDMLVAAEVSSYTQDHEASLEDKLSSAEFALTYLRARRRNEKADVSWLPGYCENFGRQVYTRSVSMPSLYISIDAISSSSRSPSKEHEERRREIHEGLCREMLKWPNLAERAFLLLLASHEASGDADAEEFVPLARDAILSAAAYRKQAPSTLANYVGYGLGYSPNQVPLRYPDEYLVRHCSQSNDWGLLDEEILPKMDEKHSIKQLQRLTDLRSLYECNEEEFIENANKAVKHRRSSMTNRTAQDGIELLVVEAWTTRGLKVDLQDTMFEFVKRDMRNTRSLQPSPFLYRYLEQLAESQDASTAAQFMERLAAKYLGPPEKRAEFIANNHTNRGVSWNSPVGYVYWFQRLMSAAFDNDVLLVPSLEFLATGNAMGLLSNAEYEMKNAASRLVKRDPEQLVAYLDSTDMLADLPELKIYPLGTNQSFLGLIAEQLGRNKNESKVVRLLKKRSPTLGRAILLADLGSSKERRSVLTHLATQQSVVKSLTEPKRQELLLALDTIDFDKLTEKGLSNEEKQSLQWYRSIKSGNDESLIDTILAAKRWEDLNIEASRADEWLVKILPDIFAHDPDRCARVYYKVVDLYDDAMSRNAVNMYYSRSVASELITQVARRMLPPTMKKLHMAVHIVAHEREGGLSLTTSDISASAIPMQSEWNAQLKSARDKKQSEVEAFKQYFEAVNAEFGESPATRLLLPGHCVVFASMKEETLGEVTTWLKSKVEAENADHLAADMLAAIGLQADSPRAQATTDDESQGKPRLNEESYHKHFVTLLEHESLPLQVRGMIGMFLNNRQGSQLPLSLSQAIAKVDTELVRRTYEINDDHHRLMCDNLLGLEGEAIWDEVISPFASSWKDRYLRVRVPQSQSRYPRSKHDVGDDRMLTKMLSIYLKLDDEESVNQLLRRYDDRIGRRSEAIALLVRAGWCERAAGLIRRHWNQLALDPLSGSNVTFDETLAEQLPEFLEEIGKEDLKYFAEAAFSGLEDPQPTPEGDFVDRETRLVKLASRFSEVPFTGTQLRDRTLLMFRASPEASDMLGDVLQKATANVDLWAAAQRNDDELEYLQALAVQHVGYAVRSGDLEPAKKLIEAAIGKEGEGRRWQLDSARRAGTKTIVEAATQQIDQWDKQQFEELGSLAIRFIEGRTSSSDIDQVNSLLVLAHLGSGKADKLPSWYKDLEHNSKIAVGREGVTEEIWDWAAQMCGPPTEENQAQRVDVATGILKLASTFDWIEPRDSLKMSLQGTEPVEEWPLDKLLTDEELLTLGPQIAKEAPADGTTWILVARRQQAAGQHQEAAESWMKARELTKGNLRRLHIIVHRAEALIDAGEPKTALKELSVLAFSRPKGELGERYDKLIDRLKAIEKEKKAAESEEENESPAEEKVSHGMKPTALLLTSSRFRYLFDGAETITV